MPRWIAFDQKTVEKLRRRFPREQVFERRARSVTDYLTGGPETLVTVLPVNSQNEAAVAVFRQRAAQPKAAVAGGSRFAVQRGAGQGRALPVQSRKSEDTQGQVEKVRPGGFLGLRDEAVFEEERQPRQKKTWWQRFWDEDE